MKNLLRNKKSIYVALTLSIVLFFVNCGLNPFTIDMPASGNANEVVTFKLNGSTEARVQGDPYVTKLLIGIMVPKGWNARENTVVSFTSSKGNETMSLIPNSEIEPVWGVNWHDAAKKRFGIGPNLVDDFEWLVYRSANSYSFANYDDIDIKVKVECKLGAENMLVKLGFFMGSSRENLRPEDTDYTKFAFSNTFEVKNGEGDLLDYVNPQLSAIAPAKSMDNDIITLTFNSGVTNTALDNKNDLFLCAKAFDANGQVAEVCERTEKTKLSAIGGKKYRIDLWPRGFFDLPNETVLTKIEYYYTDDTGMIKVGYGNSADPFKYTFKCD